MAERKDRMKPSETDSFQLHAAVSSRDLVQLFKQNDHNSHVRMLTSANSNELSGQYLLSNTQDFVCSFHIPTTTGSHWNNVGFSALPIFSSKSTVQLLQKHLPVPDKVGELAL